MTEEELKQKAEKAKKYYSQFDISEPTVYDWREWLGTLPKSMADNFFHEGFSYSLKSIPFQAWYLSEKKGLKQIF
jgi:hypothetical protein